MGRIKVVEIIKKPIYVVKLDNIQVGAFSTKEDAEKYATWFRERMKFSAFSKTIFELIGYYEN